MGPISEILPDFSWYRIGYPKILFQLFTIVDNQNIIIRVATPEDKKYSKTITDEMESSAKARGTGIAKRSPEYVAQKIDEGKAVIAVTADDAWVGFLSAPQEKTSPSQACGHQVIRFMNG